MNKARFLLPALAALMLANPVAAHLEEGQIWLLDYVNDSMYRIDSNTWDLFTTLTVVNGLNGPGAFGFTLHGDMLIANYDSSEILEWDGDTGSPPVVATAAQGLAGPFGATGLIISPGHGDIYISNFDNNEILVLDETLANPMVFADAADGIFHPVAMAFLANGLLVVGNGNQDILAFDELGAVAPFDSIVGDEITSMTVRNNGDLYVLTLTNSIYRYAGGDPGSRTLLGQYGATPGQGGIEFNPDFTSIYHISQASNDFSTIDPDTGESVVRVSLTGKRPFAMAVTGGQLPHGSFQPFGLGLPGAGAITPLLESHDEPRIGQPMTLHMENLVGGSLAYLFLGLGEDEVPLLGGDFHIDISGANFWMMRIFGTGGTPGLAGDGHVDLPILLPNDPILIGTEWFMEALVVDSAAAEGVAFSNCLKMYVGDAP
jgi:hypothetical protein